MHYQRTPCLSLKSLFKPIKYTDNNPTDFEIKEKYLYNGYDKLCFFYKLEDFKDESEIRILTSRFANPYSFAQLDPFGIQQIEKALESQQMNYEDSLRLKIDSASKLIQEIVVSPYAHNQFIKTVKQCIENINMRRRLLQTDLIECDVNESRRKEWV